MSLDDWHLIRRLSTGDEDVPYQLALPLGAASVVYVAYLLTHPYPAYGAGLFLDIAEQIATNGYRPPGWISGYTAAGVPFAYPPLAFYAVAVLVDVGGVPPLSVARVLPGLLAIACVVPFYAIASELTTASRQATLASVLFVTAPPALRWHLSGGGIVRSLAFLLALSSLYAGIRLFRTHSPRWLAAATVSFGLVVLTHPTYTVFVVVSYLLLFVVLDGSVRGLAAGAVVGIGGTAIATPWIVHVATVHGLDVFSTAAGTHGGVGVGPYSLLVDLAGPLVEAGAHWPFYVLAYLGGLYALWKRQWFLPAWLLLLGTTVGKLRFLFVPGSILAAAFVLECVVPALRDRVPSLVPNASQRVPGAVVAVVVMVAVTAGGLYGAGLVGGGNGDEPQPQFVDEADVAAMEWTSRNTPPDATFVVVGDAAEWMPFLADRTTLIGPWGVEWKNSSDYYAQMDHAEAIAACEDEACLSRSIERAGVRPRYVYVPKGSFTVQGERRYRDPTISASLATSSGFRVVFENEGVVIAAVVDGESDANDRPTADLGRQARPHFDGFEDPRVGAE